MSDFDKGESWFKKNVKWVAVGFVGVLVLIGLAYWAAGGAV